MTTEVKYVVSPMERACVVQIYVPIARAALTEENGGRLDAACRAARTLFEEVRDGIVTEIRGRGICPWCNNLAHPEGTRCLA